MKRVIVLFFALWAVLAIGKQTAVKHTPVASVPAISTVTFASTPTVVVSGTVNTVLPEEKTKSWWDRTVEILTVVGTVAVAVFTATLWWTTRKLWREAADAGRIAARSANAAEVAANAATESVAKYHDNAVKELRAYVYFALLGQITLDTNTFVKIPFKLENAGKTPAKIIYARLNFEVVDSQIEFKPSTDQTYGISSQTTLVPGQSINMTAGDGRSLSIDRVSQIVDEKKVAYLAGKVEYDDVFGVRRFTEFQYKYITYMGRFMVDEVGNNFT